MTQKPGSVVLIVCKSCPDEKKFRYTLTASPFRPKFCSDCAKKRNFENKKRFDERRKQNDVELARARRAMFDVQDREINPAKFVDLAMKMVT